MGKAEETSAAPTAQDAAILQHISERLELLLGVKDSEGKNDVEILTEYIWTMINDPSLAKETIHDTLTEFLGDKAASVLDWILKLFNDTDGTTSLVPSHASSHVDSLHSEEKTQSKISKDDESLSKRRKIILAPSFNSEKTQDDSSVPSTTFTNTKYTRPTSQLDLTSNTPVYTHQSVSNKSESKTYQQPIRTVRQKRDQPARILNLAFRNAIESSSSSSLKNGVVEPNSKINSKMPVSTSSPSSTPLTLKRFPYADVNQNVSTSLQNSKFNEISKQESASKVILKPNPRYQIRKEQDEVSQEKLKFVQQNAEISTQNNSMNSTFPNPFFQVQNEVIQQGKILPKHTVLNATQHFSPRPKIKCPHFPNCAFGDQCHFIHPSITCTKWPYCTYGRECRYVHPEVPCRYGSRCLNAYCNYSHNEQFPTSAISFRPEKISQTFKNKQWKPSQETMEAAASDSCNTNSNTSFLTQVSTISESVPKTPPHMREQSPSALDSANEGDLIL